MDIPYNEQALKRNECLILRKLGKLSIKEYQEMLIDVLECTLSLDALMSDSEKYITETEYFCVQDFALYTDGNIKEYTIEELLPEAYDS